MNSTHLAEFPGSSTVEHSAVNRRVASSNLARGANFPRFPNCLQTAIFPPPLWTEHAEYRAYLVKRISQGHSGKSSKPENQEVSGGGYQLAFYDETNRKLGGCDARADHHLFSSGSAAPRNTIQKAPRHVDL